MLQNDIILILQKRNLEPEKLKYLTKATASKLQGHI